MRWIVRNIKRAASSGVVVFLLGGMSACTTDLPNTLNASIYYCLDPQAAQCNGSVEGAEPWLGMALYRVEEPEGGPFCAVAFTNRIGNDLQVMLTLDQARRSTAFTNNRGYEKISSGRSHTDLNCLYEGADLFVKVCRYRAGGFWARFWSELDACTSTYRVHIPDMSREAPRSRLSTQVQLDKITCLDKPLAGVTVCYSWDDRTLIVRNPNDQAVRLQFEVVNRGKMLVDADSIPGKVAGQIPAEDLLSGDTLRVRGWVADPDKTESNDTADVADYETTFVISGDVTVTVPERAIRQKFRLGLDALRGVVCTFIGQWQPSSTGGVDTVPQVTRFQCLNQTGVDALMRLYAMRPSSTQADGYDFDYYAGDVGVNGGQIHNEVLSSVLLDGEVYALTYRDKGAWNQPASDAALFTIDVEKGSVSMLAGSLIAEALP